LFRHAAHIALEQGGALGRLASQALQRVEEREQALLLVTERFEGGLLGVEAGLELGVFVFDIARGEHEREGEEDLHAPSPCASGERVGVRGPAGFET
jgi:hypothetical protein